MDLKLFFVLFCFLAVCSSQPAIKSLTSIGGADKIKNIVLRIVTPIISQVRIPNTSGTIGKKIFFFLILFPSNLNFVFCFFFQLLFQDTPIKITIDYSISNIQISNFQFGSTSIQFEPNQGVLVNIDGATCTLNMNWSYQATSIDLSGSGTATDQLTVHFDGMMVIQEYQGKPVINIPYIDVKITSFSKRKENFLFL